MENIQSDEKSILTLEDAQLQKIRLQVKELQKRLDSKSDWKDKLVRMLPLVTVLLAIASFWFGVFQFYSEREKEFKKPLWEKQLEVYLEATKATATLATFIREKEGESQKEWEKARIRFWQLYYGELAVVEDKKVSQAIVEFGKCLREYKYGECDQKKLVTISLNLAQLCRDSVGESWKEPLGKVER